MWNMDASTRQEKFSDENTLCTQTRITVKEEPCDNEITVKTEPVEENVENPGYEPWSLGSEHELVVNYMKEEPYDVDMVKSEFMEISKVEPADDSCSSDSEHKLVVDIKLEPYDADSSQLHGEDQPPPHQPLETSTLTKINGDDETKPNISEVQRNDKVKVLPNLKKKNEEELRGIKNNFSENKFTCETCDQSFSEVNELDNHILAHTNEKPYQCHVCKKCFEEKIDCDTHVYRTHTGEKKTRCYVCKKNFICNSDLTKHMRIHTGEKPFQCDVCKKCFNQKCHLNAHTRIHTGEKPYQCDVCQKRFGRNGDLTLHTTLHSGERAYQCSMCQKAFNHRGNLNSHIRKVHKIKPMKV